MDTTQPQPQAATLPIPDVIPPFPKRRGSPGRPSSFNQDTADEICDRLADGESLRAICRSEHLPDFKTVFRWLQVRIGFRQQYAEARDIGLEQMAEELLEIADDGTNDFMDRQIGDGVVVSQLNAEHIQRSRLRVDTRKWYLSKLAPKRYGDRLQVEANASQQPDAPPASPVEVARRLAIALMDGANATESEG